MDTFLACLYAGLLGLYCAVIIAMPWILDEIFGSKRSKPTPKGERS
jgi:hypothetical protein